MKSLYCKECGEYLMAGSGSLVDCHCGWKQPTDEGIDAAEYEALHADYERLQADHEADKARIAELGEELAYALADFDAWASHEDNHPHDHLAAWSERARAALAKTRGDA